MLTKTFLLIIIFVLLSSIVVAQQIRKTVDGLEYEGCLVQLKQKPILDVTAGKERLLKDLDVSQFVVEHGLDVALQKNNFEDITTLSEGVAVIINEEKFTVAEEKIVVDAQLKKIVAEQENFVKSSALEQLVKDKLFLGMNGFLLDVDESQCKEIKSLPAVSGTALNYIEYTALRESLPLMCDDQQKTDNSCSVWGTNAQGFTGKGIRVAVIDTGIDYGHADFGSCTLAQINDNDPSTCPKIVGGWDFLNNDNDPLDKDPCTVAEKAAALNEPDRKSCPVEDGLYGGHGTHVASTIAGNGVLKGVAPDAKLIIFKTLGGVKGGGSSVGRIKALGCATGVLSNVGDIVIKYVPSAVVTQDEIDVCSNIKKADIVSLSLALRGTDPLPSYDPAKCDSSATTFSDAELLTCPVDRAVNNGVVAVVAAGNYGPNQGTIGNPGNSVKAITVGNSCDRHFTFANGECGVDGLSPSSSRGPTPGLEMNWVDFNNSNNVRFNSAVIPGRAVFNVETFTVETNPDPDQREPPEDIEINVSQNNFLTITSLKPSLVQVAFSSRTDFANVAQAVCSGIASYQNSLTTEFNSAQTLCFKTDSGKFGKIGEFKIVRQYMKPDVTAPGTTITAAWPAGVYRGTKCTDIDQTRCTISGTSMATPHVSGVVALMLEKNKNLQPEEVKDVLMRTAKNLGGAVYGTSGYDTDSANFNDGAGRVNALSALDAVTVLVTPPSCTPTTKQCSDGVDNDCDNLIDSADPDCAPLPAVPSWASWAARPVGVSVAQNSGSVDVKISGFDFVWLRGYRSDARVLTNGPPFSASSVWLSFNVNAGSNVVDDGWIRATNTLSTNIPSDSFVVNSQRFNAVVLYACKYLGRTSEFFEYDCNGVDNKTVKIKPDHTYHQDSGRGSWLLKDFEKV